MRRWSDRWSILARHPRSASAQYYQSTAKARGASRDSELDEGAGRAASTELPGMSRKLMAGNCRAKLRPPEDASGVSRWVTSSPRTRPHAETCARRSRHAAGGGRSSGAQRKKVTAWSRGRRGPGGGGARRPSASSNPATRGPCNAPACARSRSPPSDQLPPCALRARRGDGAAASTISFEQGCRYQRPTTARRKTRARWSTVDALRDQLVMEGHGASDAAAGRTYRRAASCCARIHTFSRAAAARQRQ